MRTIDDHKVNPANDTLTITVTDEPGAGGANHCYVVSGFTSRPSDPGEHNISYLNFQNGPINEEGVNGITHEVLLAIVIDRLKSFQAGKFSSRENALALTHIQEANHWLLERTRIRMARGVEGTHTV